MINHDIEDFKDFAIRRFEKAIQNLRQKPEYIELHNQAIVALGDLIGNDPAIKAKYRALENIEGEIHVEDIVAAYTQGLRDGKTVYQA